MKYFILSAACSFVSISLFSDSASAAEPLPLSKAYWKDAAFIKSFNGSYRINARIEPQVSTEERGVLLSIQSLMVSGERKSALKKIEGNKLIKTSAAFMFNAGNIHFELGDMEAAEKQYQSAIKIFPSFRRAYRNLGFVYANLGDWEKALPALEEALRLGDQDGSTYGQLAYGRLHQEQYASALQSYRLAQVTQPDNVDWKAGVAQCLQYLDRDEEALALLDEVIRVRPTEVSYYLLQSSIQLSLGRNDEALVNLEYVRRLGDDKLDAENHLLLAQLHIQSGNLTLAEPLLKKAVTLEKKALYTSSLNTLSFVIDQRYWELGKSFFAAINESYTGTQNPKLDAKKSRLHAVMKIESGEDLEGGVSILESLVKKDPLDAQSLVLLGRQRMIANKPHVAEMLFRQAAHIPEHEYESRVELSQLCVAMKRYPDAVKELKLALKLQNSSQLREYKEAIEKLAESAL